MEFSQYIEGGKQNILDVSQIMGWGVISVISKGWGVECQVHVRDGGPPILDYM